MVVVAVFIILALFATVALGGFINSKDQTALGRIRSQGRIVMSTDAANIPFEGYDVINGTYIGFDIDLANRITENVSADLGVPIVLEIHDVAYATIPESIIDGKVDMALSGIVITDEMNESLLFSNPYYVADTGLGVLVSSSDSSIRSITDLVNATRIAVVAGTSSENWAYNALINTGLYSADQVDSLPTTIDAVNAVKAGLSQVLIIERPTADICASESNGDLEVSAVIPAAEPYGVALDKGADDLKAIIDRTINAMIANGEMEQLRNKWGLK